MSGGYVQGSVTGDLLSDREIAALFSDDAAVREMVAVETALARIEGRLGIIPAAAAAAIERAAAAFVPDMAALHDGAEASGVPVIALVDQLRAAVGGEAASYIHWGATSQDIIDTALVLRLRRTAEILSGRLDGLIESLADLATRHRGRAMVARTRFQHALPTTFGLEVAGWRAALQRNATRLAELRPRFEVVQFGGAAGTLASLGKDGVAVMEALAAELDLGAPALPWHAHRDALTEFAGWLALVTGALGKIGLDVALHAQSEVGELRVGADGAGGSSTLAHKVNPVGAEVLVTLSRMNAALVSSAHQALLHAQQRDGSAWQLEWLTLPQMAVSCGAALRQAQDLVAFLAVDAGRMAANLAASNGMIFAEAATFALARHMARSDAQALVKDACAETRRDGTPLDQVLKARTTAPVDWAEVFDPRSSVASADALITRALARKD